MTTPSRPKLIYLLNLAERQLQQWIKIHSPKHYPSPTQIGVLFLLGKHDGLLMGEIAEYLHLVPSAVSGLIQRMEHAQYIEKRTCKKDARASRVYLTKHGKTFLPELIQHTQKLNQQLIQDMSDDEVKIIEKWLNRVIQQFPTTHHLDD